MGVGAFEMSCGCGCDPGDDCCGSVPDTLTLSWPTDCLGSMPDVTLSVSEDAVSSEWTSAFGCTPSKLWKGQGEMTLDDGSCSETGTYTVEFEFGCCLNWPGVFPALGGCQSYVAIMNWIDTPPSGFGWIDFDSQSQADGCCDPFDVDMDSINPTGCCFTHSFTVTE